MTLEDFIVRLVQLRDEHNAGDLEVVMDDGWTTERDISGAYLAEPETIQERHPCGCCFYDVDVAARVKLT